MIIRGLITINFIIPPKYVINKFYYLNPRFNFVTPII